MTYQLAQIERECLEYLGDDFVVADTLHIVRELIERDKHHNAAIAAAVQAERKANQRDMQQLADAAHMAIEYVGAANYPERQSEAHQSITDTVAAIRALSGNTKP